MFSYGFPGEHLSLSSYGFPGGPAAGGEAAEGPTSDLLLSCCQRLAEGHTPASPPRCGRAGATPGVSHSSGRATDAVTGGRVLFMCLGPEGGLGTAAGSGKGSPGSAGEAAAARGGSRLRRASLGEAG